MLHGWYVVFFTYKYFHYWRPVLYSILPSRSPSLSSILWLEIWFHKIIDTLSRIQIHVTYSTVCQENFEFKQNIIWSDAKGLVPTCIIQWAGPHFNSVSDVQVKVPCILTEKTELGFVFFSKERVQTYWQGSPKQQCFFLNLSNANSKPPKYGHVFLCKMFSLCNNGKGLKTNQNLT